MNNKLNQLAKLYGIETSYIDMRKQRVDASEESILLVLRSLGAAVSRMNDVEKALKQRREEIADRVVEPVLVAWDGKLQANVEAKATLVLENGKTAAWPRRMALPAGYHRLVVKGRGRTHESLIISAPVKAHFPLSRKAWGVFAPVYALHSKRSSSAGDLTDLESVMDWMRSLGGQVVSTLPLLANFLAEPSEPSPYSPVSRIFWNEFYIDPVKVPEFTSCMEAQRLLARKPKVSKYVDYRATMAAKRRILEALAESFFAQRDTTRHDEFQNFLRLHPGVSEYARFRAVTDRQRRGWNEWPERLRSGKVQSGDWDEDVREYHLYAQWVIQDQLGQLAENTKYSGGLLYLDLPLGLHPDSYDTWQYRKFFVKGMAGGAPPDPVFTTGQNWAFPPMHPEAMRTNRYEYLIAYLRNHLLYAKLLRIDHVMGLHRLYWIPEGLSGDKGLYVQYPAEEMYAILSLESHRYGAGIVGENLGVVPQVVEKSMARHNIQQLYVVQFETAVDSMHALRPPPSDCVASLNTHDMFPFRAFLEGADIKDRIKLGFLSVKEAEAERKERVRALKALGKFVGGFEGCTEFLGKSNARIVLVNLEDLWGETQPQNIPSTTKERPNWRRRMRYSIERIKKAKEVEGVLRRLDDARKRPLLDDPERPSFENSVAETKNLRSQNSPKRAFPDRPLA